MACPFFLAALFALPLARADNVLTQPHVKGPKNIESNLAPEPSLDDTLGVALYEAATGLFSCSVVALIARMLGIGGSWGGSNRNIKASKSAKAAKSRKTIVEDSQPRSPTSSPAAVKKAGSRSAAHQSPPAPKSGADRIAAATNFLAGAIAGGKAAQLPQLLDGVMLRLSLDASANPSTKQAEAAQLLLSSVRACASKRKFVEALAAYDHMAELIGDGCNTTWSLLLWSAVESGQCTRGHFFAKRLRATGSMSHYDFVNLVRCSMHTKDVKQFVAILEDCRAANLTLDVLTRNKALSVLTSNNAIDLAVEFVSRTAEIPLDVIAYNTMMRGYALSGKSRLCLQLYEQMCSAGLAPSDVTFGVLLDACVGEDMLEEARRVFEDLRASSTALNVVHYTTFIKGLVRAGSLDEARGLIVEMHRTPKTRPDVITYSTLAKAYAERGSVDDAYGLLEMMRRQGIEPDCVLFNITLSACSTKPVGAAKIQEIFENVLRFGFQPTSSTFSVLVKACVKSECLWLALQLVRSAPSRFGFWPEPRIYSQLAQAFSSAGAGSELVQTYSAMMEAFRARGEEVDTNTSMRFLRFGASCGISADALARVL